MCVPRFFWQYQTHIFDASIPSHCSILFILNQGPISWCWGLLGLYFWLLLWMIGFHFELHLTSFFLLLQRLRSYLGVLLPIIYEFYSFILFLHQIQPPKSWCLSFILLEDFSFCYFVKNRHFLDGSNDFSRQFIVDLQIPPSSCLTFVWKPLLSPTLFSYFENKFQFHSLTILFWQYAWFFSNMFAVFSCCSLRLWIRL